MFIWKLSLFACAGFLAHLLLPDGAWAWGPGVHALTALSALKDAGDLPASVAAVIRAFPREFLYGSFAADFYIGKSVLARSVHLHHWEGGFRFLRESADERESAFAHGFLCHLAADVIGHNFYVPNLLISPLATPRKGHIYWEVKADEVIGPGYTRLAREILAMEHQECDELLHIIGGKSRNGMAAKKSLFAQSVKFSDYLQTAHYILSAGRVSHDKAFVDYLSVMVRVSCGLVKDLLIHGAASDSLRYDPMGKKNLGIARRRAIVARASGLGRHSTQFLMDQGLLDL
jgi:hypothetical protein